MWKRPLRHTMVIKLSPRLFYCLGLSFVCSRVARGLIQGILKKVVSIIRRSKMFIWDVV